MIRVHHLNNSRSQRILWLLEELQQPYELVKYQRDATTNLAPPELLAIHPLGKSPVIELDGRVLAESGAIVESLIRRLGEGRLAPRVDTPEFDQYLFWLHFAEGSAMLPLLLRFLSMKMQIASPPLSARIDSETAKHLGFLNDSLDGRSWLVGEELSGADIMMSFVGELAGMFGALPAYPAIAAWKDRYQARPAWLRALEVGGTYDYA